MVFADVTATCCMVSTSHMRFVRLRRFCLLSCLLIVFFDLCGAGEMIAETLDDDADNYCHLQSWRLRAGQCESEGGCKSCPGASSTCLAAAAQAVRQVCSPVLHPSRCSTDSASSRSSRSATDITGFLDTMLASTNAGTITINLQQTMSLRRQYTECTPRIYHGGCRSYISTRLSV